MHSFPLFSVSPSYVYDVKDSVLCLKGWDVVIPIVHLWVIILAYTVLYTTQRLDASIGNKFRIEYGDC